MCGIFGYITNNDTINNDTTNNDTTNMEIKCYE